MKLLALITDGFGAGGGIAQYNRDLMTGLSQSKHVESLVALPRFGGAGAPPLRGFTQLPPAPGRLAWSSHALRWALQRRFDVIFCGHINAVPLAAALARMTRAKLWLQTHGFEAWTAPTRLVRRATERAALVTAVSRFTRARLLAWADIAPDRVRVLPNTVAAAYAPRAPRAEIAARYGLAGRKVILTVGRIAKTERYKGHDRIIAALPVVVAGCPETLYLVVGSGADRPRLEELARSLGVADRVVFAGQVPADELPDHFALADVFAMPSTGEGFGIVFLEAARCGLPVIGGNRDGSSDALADGAIGRLIDPFDPSALAGALIDVLQRPRAAAALGAGVHRFAFDNFASHIDDLVDSLS